MLSFLLMNRSPFAILIALIISLVVMGCGNHEKRPAVSFNEIEKRAPFTAKVDVLYLGQVANTNLQMKDFVVIGVQSQNGERFCIGDPNLDSNLMPGFARTLKAGQSYEFPKVLLDYK